MIFDLYAFVSNFNVNRAHNFIGYFSNGSSSYIVCVCNHYCRTNQNHSTVILMSPVSCVSKAFSSYHVFLFIYYNWYHLINQFRSMMSLTMMGLTPGPLVRALFLFALINPSVVLTIPLVVLVNPLVVFLACVMVHLYRQESSQLVALFRWLYLYQR